MDLDWRWETNLLMEIGWDFEKRKDLKKQKDCPKDWLMPRHLPMGLRTPREKAKLRDFDLLTR